MKEICFSKRSIEISCCFCNDMVVYLCFVSLQLVFSPEDLN